MSRRAVVGKLAGRLVRQAVAGRDHGAAGDGKDRFVVARPVPDDTRIPRDEPIRVVQPNPVDGEALSVVEAAVDALERASVRTGSETAAVDSDPPAALERRTEYRRPELVQGNRAGQVFHR